MIMANNNNNATYNNKQKVQMIISLGLAALTDNCTHTNIRNLI